MQRRSKNILCADHVKRKFKNFRKHQSGQIAVMMAFSLPLVLGFVGVAVDFGLYGMKKRMLQGAADQAAIAGAKELALARIDDGIISTAADEVARAYLNNGSLDVDVQAEVISGENQVKVKVTEIWMPFFAHFLKSDVTPISAEATAGLFGESKLCVLALSTSGVGAVSMVQQSSLKADGCTVYSNSNHASSVYMGDSASMEAHHMCTVGGVKDNGSLNAGKVVTDCPVLADPLVSRVGPKVGSCDYTKLQFSSGIHALTPGVYCEGLSVTGTAVVTLAPGDYVIKDGPLQVKDTATFRGKDVGFYLTGTFGLLNFANNATIDLNGRESGPMAGMLLFDDPAMKSLLRVHRISATKARNLTGTIYLPNANLLVDPAASVGQDSAYTAIVVKRLIVEGGPTLVLNTNYDETPVPVPEGIKSSSDIHLVD